jgi:hypothetical protein
MILLSRCDYMPKPPPPAIPFLFFKEGLRSQECWYTPVILALRMLKQDDWEFKASLGYIVRPCLKTNKQKRDPEMPLFLLVLQGFPFTGEESLDSSHHWLPRFPQKVNLQL